MLLLIQYCKVHHTVYLPNDRDRGCQFLKKMCFVIFCDFTSSSPPSILERAFSRCVCASKDCLSALKMPLLTLLTAIACIDGLTMLFFFYFFCLTTKHQDENRSLSGI